MVFYIGMQRNSFSYSAKCFGDVLNYPIVYFLWWLCDIDAACFDHEDTFFTGEKGHVFEEHVYLVSLCDILVDEINMSYLCLIVMRIVGIGKNGNNVWPKVAEFEEIPHGSWRGI